MRAEPTTPDPASPPGSDEPLPLWDDPLWSRDGSRRRPVRSGWRICLLGILITLIGLLTRNLWLAVLGFGAISGPLVSKLLRPRIRLDVRPWIAGRAVVGEPAHVVLRVRNEDRRSLPSLLLTCRTDGFEPLLLRLPPLGPGEVGRIEAEQLPTRRGESARTWVRVESKAPFGLAARYVVHRLDHPPALVHPRRKPPERIEQLAGDGERPSGQRGRDGSQPWSLREYRPGDPVRQVHWRSSARRGELVVVEPEHTVSERVAILAAGGTDDPDWEDVLARTAWTVADLLSHGGEVLLATAGSASATRDPTTALDWFARLPDALPPDAGDLGRQLRAVGGGDVLVLAPAAVPPGWWAMAQQVAGAAGCRLLRAGP